MVASCNPPSGPPSLGLEQSRNLPDGCICLFALSLHHLAPSTNHHCRVETCSMCTAYKGSRLSKNPWICTMYIVHTSHAHALYPLFRHRVPSPHHHHPGLLRCNPVGASGASKLYCPPEMLPLIALPKKGRNKDDGKTVRLDSDPSPTRLTMTGTPAQTFAIVKKVNQCQHQDAPRPFR
ncbi:uncharacterized protein LY79DRAFT_562800 [Colletotrichum navitas]|uniref:Uncharacterized protein n=1 Tax=Colletotrichum navitas TaxID=681940 RepID=A0AAD8PU03_9PEZI|nr:uncharacterized protein LY79DRAFT_562800 [Colletotrichum navitas]KAK1580079.1 hypothetical protein LY79DRAFT_562800 [Colletotrichum navitas]